MGGRFLSALAWAASACLVGACGPPDPRPIVVWIEIDTLRSDALGCYGSEAVGEGGATTSPWIDDLAESSVRFERAYAVAPWTIPSLVTQTTGLWPHEHGALRIGQPLDARLERLPEMLRDAGWRTAGVTTNFVTRRDVTPGFRQGFDRWHEELATGHEGSRAREALAQLSQDARELRDEPSDGLFLFALLFEPHFRYEQHEGRRFGPGFDPGDAEPYAGSLTGDETMAELRALRAELDERDAAFLRGRYHSEVAEVDEAILEFLGGLVLSESLEDMLIVVVSDHGEELLDRGWIGHTVTLHDELVRVPLLLKLPGNAHAGRVVEEPVSQLDLCATVLDYALPDAPPLGRSRSLRGLLEGGEMPRRYLLLHSDFEPPIQDESTREKRTLKWGVVDGLRRLKYVEDRLAGTVHLYDLESDPGERVDLAGTGRSEEAELAAVLRSLERGEDVE